VKWLTSVMEWLAGGATPYHTLYRCMQGDVPWLVAVVALDVLVVTGYVVIALHWQRNQRLLPNSPAKKALSDLRTIFLLCAACGYLFVPLKLVWPAWRLLAILLLPLAFVTWRYALSAQSLRVVYRGLSRAERLERELRDREHEAEVKTHFLRSLSHDIRTPMSGVLMQAEVAAATLRSGDLETARQAIALIQASARQAGDVVDGVLELGRAQWAAESIDPKRIDAAAVAEDVVEAARGEAWAKSLEIALDVERPAWLVTDASMLRRVLMNLVSNAVKYTDRGTVRMRVRADRHAVRFDVIDTGRGIEPDRVARVFDTYFQEDNPARKPGRGYGLGLTIVNRLVQRLGGTIDLESTPGRGSTFTVVLPTDHFAATPATPEDTP
jgi:signal transduction histidine kinase